MPAGGKCLPAPSSSLHQAPIPCSHPSLFSGIHTLSCPSIHSFPMYVIPLPTVLTFHPSACFRPSIPPFLYLVSPPPIRPSILSPPIHHLVPFYPSFHPSFMIITDDKGTISSSIHPCPCPFHLFLHSLFSFYPSPHVSAFLFFLHPYFQSLISPSVYASVLSS